MMLVAPGEGDHAFASHGFGLALGRRPGRLDGVVRVAWDGGGWRAPP
jgi:hypothetical protein